MKGWMDGWMDGWMEGWRDGWRDDSDFPNVTYVYVLTVPLKSLQQFVRIEKRTEITDYTRESKLLMGILFAQNYANVIFSGIDCICLN